MKLLFYITQFDQVKDATQFYLETICEALTGSAKMQMTDKISDLKDADYVMTFTVTDFFRLKLKNPKIKIIHWFQGIIPEEARLKTKNRKQYFAFSMLERFTLKFAIFNFFVSDAMKNHYRKKYAYKKKNYFIMPCFNGKLQHKRAFFEKDYTNPDFVYIGSMATWQCVDTVLSVFKSVKDKIPKARLTLLTGQQEKAEKKCAKYNVEASIGYVPLENIDQELLNYKYGFLLRDDINVNRVATPTKMSTYMASGVVPVYTDVIEAFSVFNSLNYQVKINNSTVTDIAEKIINFEKQAIDNEILYEEYKQVFENYYSKKKYIKNIKEIFKA
ncbi:glycosyltransferase family protein [Mesonia aquimarina]|uniref:glycosyltransferase n=1 Tax=Mesonia aquimarina TaxID=1504967 RepID=UPI000EF5BF8C|nr:glycosyltransferase [Mesonia aquimarina]